MGDRFLTSVSKTRAILVTLAAVAGHTLAATAPPIPPSCPAFPPLNLPGVLCETFDTNRNGAPGFQWTRLPIGADPNDPLRAIGDPGDDVLGYTMSGGPSPLGTGGVICSDDNLGYVGCQAPVAEENDWHLHSPFEGPGAGYTPPGQPVAGAPDGGKAHSGFRSMHMGRHLNPTTTIGDTLRYRQVAAFVLDSQGDSNPGLVIGPDTIMSFWHMISVPDDELYFGSSMAMGDAFGGGQLQMSLLGSDGRFERWKPLTPIFNGYDARIQETISVCGFDPTDDAIAPADETMCDFSPLYVEKGDIFGTDPTCVTDTDENDAVHKDCGRISCPPGAGCTETGSIGAGVWTRSAFDLSPFAGRVARLRWIGMMEGGWSFSVSPSALEPSSGIPYQYYDGDDGWYLDDIVLTDLRQAPGPCTGDDDDGDGLTECDPDCNDQDGTSWAPPSDVFLEVTFDPSTRDTTLTWTAPVEPGGTMVHYDVLTGERTDFRYASCMESNSTDRVFTHPDSTPWINLSYYLIRAKNGCASTAMGGIGTDSDGTPRVGKACQ